MKASQFHVVVPPLAGVALSVLVVCYAVFNTRGWSPDWKLLCFLLFLCGLDIPRMILSRGLLRRTTDRSSNRKALRA